MCWIVLIYYNLFSYSLWQLLKLSALSSISIIPVGFRPQNIQAIENQAAMKILLKFPKYTASPLWSFFNPLDLGFTLLNQSYYALDFRFSLKRVIGEILIDLCVRACTLWIPVKSIVNSILWMTKDRDKSYIKQKKCLIKELKINNIWPLIFFVFCLKNLFNVKDTKF